MIALRNWLRCLLTGHRYDITTLKLQRLVYCDCCGRELFNRRAPIAICAPTPSDIPFTGGEGQAKEGQEAENQQPMDAADAAHIVKAINSGRFAATRSAAIATPRKSLDGQPLLRMIHYHGAGDYSKPMSNDRRFTFIDCGGGA